MEEVKNRYYVRINGHGRIIKNFSSVFENAVDGDIEIGEGIGSQFRASKEVLSEQLQQYADVENGLVILNENGLYCLQYKNGVIDKVDENELKEEFENLPKEKASRLEILEEENVMLMETVTELYEVNLGQDIVIEELKQDNLEMMLALTEIYENVM